MDACLQPHFRQRAKVKVFRIQRVAACQMSMKRKRMREFSGLHIHSTSDRGFCDVHNGC